MFVEIVIGIIIGTLVGGVIGFVIFNSVLKGKKAMTLKEAEIEAETVKKDKILQAKEKFLQLKEEHEKVISSSNQKMQERENKMSQKEKTINQQIEENTRKDRELTFIKENLEKQLNVVSIRQQEVDKIHQKQVAELEKLSGYSVEDAKAQLVEALKDEARTGAMAYIKDIQDEAKLNANREAKKIVIQTIQRVATEQAIENAVSVFNIESDELKGRIIGREGRNIRALEAATGVEIIVDDTPEAIILSCFDPIRREIARLSLHQLVSDGRIHPARIEEVVAKTRKSLTEEIIETGKQSKVVH